MKAGSPERTNASYHKLEITGIFGISCRHGFIKSSVVDFHKGERLGLINRESLSNTNPNRFHYVDVAMAAVVNEALDMGLQDIIISYDVACKYSVNYIKRVTAIIEDTTQSTGPTRKAALVNKDPETLASCLFWRVPKFHLGGHQDSCAEKFSFNYEPLSGRTHGEHVETIWSDLNAFKYQTSEMSTGHRQEVIGHGMNTINWGKLTKIGKFRFYLSPLWPEML
jgi:hypothetical protein